MIRELELLFQASRTSPMLHEAAVTVEEGIAALRSERDELVLQNERLGNDIVAAEAEAERLRDGLRRIVDNAEAWHGPEEAQPDAKHRALGVIAQWGRALLAEDGAA